MERSCSRKRFNEFVRQLKKLGAFIGNTFAIDFTLFKAYSQNCTNKAPSDQDAKMGIGSKREAKRQRALGYA
ncbi:MAG: hypothetical protein ACUVTD_02780 [Nitrososphaerales archaeon]